MVQTFFIINILSFTLLSCTLSIKISSTGYHVFHGAVNKPFSHLDFVTGNRPRYHIPTPLSVHKVINSSPAIASPFTSVNTANAAYGSHFPTPGNAICPSIPNNCESTNYRSLDGSCNHLEQSNLGTANSRYGRLVRPNYSDGVSDPPKSISGNDLPSARLISLSVFGEMDVQDPNFTLINMQWGQIITHDMSMQAGGTQSKKHPTRCCTDSGRLIEIRLPKECFAILVPPNDPFFSEGGIECLDFIRTLTDKDLKCVDGGGYAEQLSVVTAYMDLSLVYGNSIQQNSEIRAFQNGRMIVEERNGAEWLPSSRNSTADCEVADPNEICYKAGDTRVNQNPGLTILQTVLIREHNRIADILAHLNPHYDDRTIFQEARKINIAQYQHISYYEWLPLFLGQENMIANHLIHKTAPHSYINDFDDTIDPSVLNEHATAAFRYFHTQIEGRLDLISELRSIEGSLRLSDWLNRPGILEIDDNFDRLSRGHTTQPEELTDINLDREIKHFLFRGNMLTGTDLKALDIQRNRDHGLATYNTMREFCGLRRANNWEGYSDLISINVIEKLKTLYESHEDVELTVGAALESHVAGALAGPTFLCILTEQFYRTRIGDRFFYENGFKFTGFTPDQLNEIRKSSIARLMCNNGNQITSMQQHAFITVSKTNPIVPCSEIPDIDLTKWIDQNPLKTNNFHYGK